MNPDERLLDLLSAHATEGLNQEDLCELERLLTEGGMSDELEKMEVSATAFDLATIPVDSELELPDSLRDKVLMGAGQYFGHSETMTDTLPSPATPSTPTGSSRWRVREGLGWLVAVATLLLGIWLGSVRPTDDGDTAQALTQADYQLAVDRVSSSWVGVHNKEVRGEVVWSDELQGGYMVFDNLPVNDPQQEQYQLWIFDTDVNQAVPVDGGVFDIASEGLNTVLFRPTHPVKQGVQFAVTIENPGGVQQSDRSRLPVIATIAQDDLKGPPGSNLPTTGDSAL